MRLTVEERVFILESYLKRCITPTVDKVSLKNLEGKRQYITRDIEEVNERRLRKVARNMVKRVDKCIEMNGHHFQHLL